MSSPTAERDRRKPDGFSVLELHELTGPAAATPDYRQASLWALVLAAMAISHKLELRDGQWLLLVAAEDEAAARRELANFEEENRNWPQKPAEHLLLTSDQHPPTVPIMGGLVIFYLVTGPWQGDNPWFAAGAVSSERILADGEWWRLVTGLTLHADPVHLLGNLLIGGVLIHLLCKQLGSGLGWALLLLSGVLGNLLNILLRGEHLSVGFSTAVFGAVGLLSGLHMRRGAGFGKGLLLPLGAALSLLAFLGTEGERTDLGAHLWGLAAGLGLGAAFARFVLGQRLMRPHWQSFLLAASLLVVTVSWWLALG
jgi:rhomboid protease GluP